MLISPIAVWSKDKVKNKQKRRIKYPKRKSAFGSYAGKDNRKGKKKAKGKNGSKASDEAKRQQQKCKKCGKMRLNHDNKKCKK
jgi:hypothetical protein